MTDDGERLAVAGEGFAEGEKPEGRGVRTRSSPSR